jgi:cation:H+ antiporter
LGLVVVGGKLAVDGAARLSGSLGVRDSAIGLTFVALATSAELFALLWAARRHHVTELALAAIVGSLIGNATLTLGAAALVRPLDAGGVTAAAWAAAALSATLVLPKMWTGPRHRLVGCLLLAGYGLFVVVTLA